MKRIGLLFSCVKFNRIQFPDQLIRVLLIYKQLQILVAQINLCCRQVLLPAVLVYLLSVNIFGVCTTVALKSELFRHPGNAIFPILSMGSGLGILALGTMSGFINKRSKECKVLMEKKALQVEPGLRSVNLLRKVALSSAQMKIRFGSNYMEISTPLVMTSFCARTVVRLLLLRGR